MTEYDQELIDFYQRNGKKLPSLQTGLGMALAWLSQPDMRGGIRWIDRVMAEEFFRENGHSSGDAIQAFNKPGGSTPGLKLLKKTYSVDVHDRLTQELSHIKWSIEHILDQPVRDWQIGHLDATKGNHPSNLYYQPPIQARFRDNYVFNREFERIKVKA